MPGSSPSKSLRLIGVAFGIIFLVALSSCPDKTTGPQALMTPFNLKPELINPDTIQLSWADCSVGEDYFLIDKNWQQRMAESASNTRWEYYRIY